MRLLLTFAVFIGLVLFAGPARAIQKLEYSEETVTTTYVVPFVNDYTKTPDGGIAWDVLAKTEEIPYEEPGEDGIDMAGVRPGFPDAVKALDGKVVTMQGFMFPLGPDEKQAQFLFGPFPMTCPYHYHVSPAMVIEVAIDPPLPFTYDPVTLTGRLELVPRDDMFNVFYRLKDTRVIHEQTGH